MTIAPGTIKNINAKMVIKTSAFFIFSISESKPINRISVALRYQKSPQVFNARFETYGHPG